MSQTKKNIMTYEGIKKLEEELEYLSGDAAERRLYKA